MIQFQYRKTAIAKIYFIRHDFHDILNLAIQRCTNLHEYLRGDMPIPSHFSDGCWADTHLFTQVFFLHVFIDEQLPEFFITHRHKYLLRTDTLQIPDS